MEFSTIFYQDSQQKQLKKWRGKSIAATKIQSANCLEIEFKVACYVTESMEFGKIYGFYDVRGNFELDFRAVVWLYPVAA